MAPSDRILFVAPPWRMPHTSTLALATLRPILRASGYGDVDELHGSTLFPRTSSDFEILESYAKFLFVPALTGCEVEPFLDSVMHTLLVDANIKGVVAPPETVSFERLGMDGKRIRQNFRDDIDKARVCLDRVFERMTARDYGVVGFSATFDDQVPAAIELARRIKSARPETRVILGGAACLEEQADGLMSSFAELDAVCHTEGESVIVPLMRALDGELPMSEVPGVSWRDDSGEVVHNPSPPLLVDMDTLPIPDFGPFMEQFEDSVWVDLEARLLFETSRGCWWGQKKLCTFCGLNAEGLGFRAKSPERAYEEIAHLYKTYKGARYLQATDNILDMKYITNTFPRLAELERDMLRPLRMFYEVKSNMRADQVEVMASAGVQMVQPGIESFHDEVLRNMRKGCTALGQIQFIKWCDQYGVDPLYNIILCNPGDQPQWYIEMAELVPYLLHLTPPTGITTMLLERFSPYFNDPEAFDITNIRPREFYDKLYPEDGVDLDRIAYQFDFDHPLYEDRALMAAYRRFVNALHDWRNNHKPDSVFYVDTGERVVIVDRRAGAERRHTLAGMQAQLYVYLDQHRPRSAIARKFGLEPAFLDCLLTVWHRKRWLCTDGNDRWLALFPRRGTGRATAQQQKAARRSLPMAI